MASAPRILILPGFRNSEPEHWQSRWEAEHPSFERVNQPDWERPERKAWVAGLHSAIISASSPVILVAHSLGCAQVAWWACEHKGPVCGALLVAPSDVEAPGFPPEPQGFKPMPLTRLPFASIVVASTNDPYISVAKAQQFASAWGSQIKVLGPRGHINSASNLGVWPEGFTLLRELAPQLSFF